MDRRVFLQGMVALAVAASTAAVVPEAVAAVAEVAKPNKYKEAIRLFDRCVAVSQDEAEVSARFNTMLTYLRENFEVPAHSEEMVETLNNFLFSPLDVAGIRSIPPSVADNIYPVALAKMGLLTYKMKANPGRIPEFDWFHASYGRMIIDGMDATRRTAKRVA